MNIREATITDAEGIRELILAAGESGREADFDELGWNKFLSLAEIEPVEKRLQAPEYLTLCYLEDGNILGIIAIKKFEAIDQLFVLPGKQRQGIASRLWESAKEACLSNGNEGYFRVKSSTLAVPVYASFGFVPTGNRVTQDGVSFTPMELAL